MNPEVTQQARPQGLQDGITYVDDNTVRLSLFAPNKEFVYVIGDFTNWEIDPNYFMNKEEVNADSSYFWIEFDIPDPNKEYGFQYFVDGEIRVADPYSEKILDPFNDQYISSETYPNLNPYPEGKTDKIVGVLQPGKQDYNWQHNNYDRPDKENLVVYELLVRDFVANHDFKTVTDSLDYLQQLGVNAIELMPIMEFDANSSWGYNPTFHLATDKYYGPAEDLKRLIDEAHSRGMAVILDMVLNHAWGPSPLARLWNDGDYGKPTAQNPYLNREPKHDFNVGYDFNHESQATKYFVDRVNRFWLEEFNFDGFRFDLSKGFTQNNTLGNVGAWGQYDASRVQILKRMADKIWATDDSAYVILEHFAENQEEQELSNYGMMTWGNMHHSYKQASMGYQSESNFSGIYHENRSWNNAHLVGYMESHDEQRIMYENLNFGNSNSSGSYDITELNTALNRIKLSSAFFFTVPGPKMLWQFGELGYEVDINQSGRTGEKPIRWEYYQDENRKKLYDTYKALIRLRNSHEAFTSETSNVTMDVNGTTKRITISHPNLEVSIAGNFGVTDTEMQPQFTQSGDWYDFFSGDTLSVNNTDTTIAMSAGEFHIYTTQKFQAPTEDLLRFVPTQINLDISQSFDAASSPQDYRLIALPGQTVEPLVDVLNGDPSVDWQAYWDNGQQENYWVKYDGSSTFNMNSGNGFWVTSKEDFTYDQTVPTVELNENNQASIPLHDGWNIISNPLHTDVAWSQVSAANGGNLQPLWRFDGSYSEAADFISARSGEAFYFLNDQGLNELLIPYEETSSKNKTEAKQNEVQLITQKDGEKTSSSSLTFVDSEEPPADVVAPPSRFEGTSLRFAADNNKQKSSRTSSLAHVFRNQNKEEHRLEVILLATPKEPVSISAKGWDNNPGIQMALLNTESGRKYDLSNENEITIIPDKEKTSMLLVIGDTRYINEQQEELLPKEISINPNYPNPFNPSTTLRFSLPEQTEVQVQVFNVLGQRVSTLINNETRQAGVHTVTFDGSQRASGLYFAVFEIGNQRFIQKMTLIK
ncbi:alpha-amylase family glycosyl hydrolase [Fodinibius sp.]|uniref:alpha-amylase family glycosyl hydrolase n=1 Tax=Fodinibius sp. TaxID=1872440 RepID=UPI002ACD3339|nr:alpha-amylase family glycosyl hydrolase [Fodinibius sp.]MDZ7660088.1 alpha-amylase family glycosyl hydrolase [Fodinibius sp.]